MQLRQHMSLEPSGKAKAHLVKRLRKAGVWANRLEEVCNSKANVKTQLEAQAYKFLMHGNLLLEQKKWD